MAGERTFTEGEAYALVDDAVKRETAAAAEQVVGLEARVTELSNENDALSVRVTAAENKAASAEKALEDHKAEIETQKAAEAKRSTRVATVSAVTSVLDLTGERGDRIVAMSDEGFEEYVSGLREIAATAPHAWAKGEDAKCSTCGGDEAVALHTQKASEDKTTSGGIPRQTAAFGGGSGPGDAKPSGSVKGLFGARRALTAPANKSA